MQCCCGPFVEHRTKTVVRAVMTGMGMYLQAAISCRYLHTVTSRMRMQALTQAACVIPRAKCCVSVCICRQRCLLSHAWAILSHLFGGSICWKAGAWWHGCTPHNIKHTVTSYTCSGTRPDKSKIQVISLLLQLLTQALPRCCRLRCCTYTHARAVISDAAGARC